MTEQYWRNKLEQFGKTYGQNLERLKSILFENRGYVMEEPINETVILLFSGGLDSTILIDLVIRKWKCKVILLYFKRNSKNQKWEEESVKFFYKFYKERWPDNILELISLEMEIPSRINKEFMDSTRQKIMMLPLRNATMWDNAFTQAIYLSGKYSTTIRTVIIGSVKEDLSSPESGILSILSHNVHVNISLGLWYYQLLAPFIDGSLGKIYNKRDLLEYGRDFDIPLEKSRSCFEASKEPCNACLACENRNRAYLEYEKK